MAILCKHADIFFLLLQQLHTKSGGGFSSSRMMPVGDLKCKNRDFFKAISRNFQNFEMQNNNCLFGRVKKKQKHILRKGVKTDTNCKRKRGHLGSGEYSPRWLQHCWNSTISHPSLVPAPHWGQNKSMSVEKARSWHALSLSWTVYRWHSVRQARPALHSFNAESMGSSFLTSPAPPPHLSGTTTFHYTLWVSPPWVRLI